MNSLELLLRKAESYLRWRQICTYWKIPTDLRLTKNSAVFGAQSPCDFIGHTTDGRALLIEAKMCQRPSLPVPNSGGIKGHQWMALRDAHRAGAVALIVWQRGDKISVLPFDVAEKIRGSRRSIPWTGGIMVKLTPRKVADILADAIQCRSEIFNIVKGEVARLVKECGLDHRNFSR